MNALAIVSFYCRVLTIATLLALISGTAPAEINPDVFLARSQVSRVLDASTRAQLKSMAEQHQELDYLKSQTNDPLELFYAAVAALEERHRPRKRHEDRLERIERGRELLEDYLGQLQSGPRAVELDPPGEVVRPWSDPEGGVHVLRFFPPPKGVNDVEALRQAAREDLKRLEALEKESRAELEKATEDDLELQRFVTHQARVFMQFDESELLKMRPGGASR